MIRIVSAKPLPRYRLKISFDDGVSGVFAVEPEHRGGVFLKLLDSGVFNAVTINPDFGCVEWPGGIDLCPETMHQALTSGESAATGSPVAALRDEAQTRQAYKTAPDAPDPQTGESH